MTKKIFLGLLLALGLLPVCMRRVAARRSTSSRPSG